MVLGPRSAFARGVSRSRGVQRNRANHQNATNEPASNRIQHTFPVNESQHATRSVIIAQQEQGRPGSRSSAPGVTGASARVGSRRGAGGAKKRKEGAAHLRSSPRPHKHEAQEQETDLCRLVCSPLPPPALTFAARAASGFVGRLLCRHPGRSTKIHRNLLSSCSSKSRRHANCWRACTFVIYDNRGNWFLRKREHG